MLHDHWGLLIDHSSRKPYPMVPIGDFSLVDKIFPGSPMDSLLFNGEELTRLKRKGYQISTFQREKLHSSSPRREEQLSSCSLGDMLGFSSKEGEPPKTSSKSPPGLLPIPQAARNHHPAAAKALPGQRNGATKSHTAGPSNIRTNHMGTRAASMALIKKPPSPCTSSACLHHHDLLSLRGWVKSATWKILSRP